ncbi:MAG: acetate--CoA ligase family protein [Burkholderiales bacterium]|nr:acetate--CoA ligase family protein [Burkholderiales bacterium]
MLITENEGKALLAAHGIAVPHGSLIRNATQLRRWSAGFPVAVKAQVSSGGRGKAGGVLRASDTHEAESAARRLFEREFGGERPRALLVEPWLDHQRELYLGLTADGAVGGYAMLYSPRGGVDVERNAPVKYPFGPPGRFRAHEFRRLLSDVEENGAVRERVVAMARRLVFMATAIDAVTIEINPLAVMADGKLLALDAKIVRDEAAAFRHAEVADALGRARRRERPAVAKALANKLMMVWLEGEIGLISGGAGMTMAAMDLISDAGLSPACFLDCSSNPTPAGYATAFKLLDAEPGVKAILVSIFGGGTRIDKVAGVMRDIMKKRRSRKPVYFRLNGTGKEKADAVMQEAGLENHPALESAIDALAARMRGQ